MDLPRYYKHHPLPTSTFSRNFEKKNARQSRSRTSMNSIMVNNVNPMKMHYEEPYNETRLKSVDRVQQAPPIDYHVGDHAEAKIKYNKQQLLYIKDQLDFKGASFEMKLRQRLAKGIFETDLKCANNWGAVTNNKVKIVLPYEKIPPCMKRLSLGNQIIYGCKFMTPDRFAKIPEDILNEFPICNSMHSMFKAITVIRNHCLPSFVKQQINLYEHLRSTARVNFKDSSLPDIKKSEIKEKKDENHVPVKKGWNTCMNSPAGKMPAEYLQNFPDLSEIDLKFDRKGKAKHYPEMQ